MKTFVLENFRKATIKSMEVREGTTEFYHNLIAGYLPLWKMGVNSGELTNAKNDTFYPLFPSVKLNTATSFGTYGTIISTAKPVSTSSNGDFYVVTSKGRVLGLNKSGVVTDYGYFYGTALSPENVGLDIATFDGKIVVVYPASGVGYYKNEDNTGAWTTFGTLATYTRLARVFANWLYISDTYGTRRRIRIFNTSFVEQTPSFSLGTGSIIDDIVNIDNVYIAVIAKSSYSGDYKLYVWDGTPGGSFIKEIPFIGNYHTLKKVGSTWYLISYLYNNTYIYVLSGFSLILKKIFYGMKPTGSSNIFRSNSASIGNYLITPVTDGTNYYLLFYNFDEDEIFYNKLSGSGDIQNGLTEVYSSSGDYLALFTSTEGTMKYINIGNSIVQNPSYYFSSSLTGEYKSNWINLGNIVIRAIEIFYDGKPDTGGSISVNLETKNEYARIDYSSVNVGSVTNSDNKHRKIFTGLGYTCNKFRIGLTITHGGTDTWSGAVKKIVVHYELTNRKI